MSDNDLLAKSIAEWQHKHRIADDDPVLAVLELVRLQIQHVRANRDDADESPPGFEDFRGTIELLDRRSKAFIQQATDLLGEMRRLGNYLRRLNSGRILTHTLFFLAGVLVGVLIVRVLM